MSHKFIGLMMIALLCGSLIFSSTAHAETSAGKIFNVNSLLDEPDANPGNTQCVSTPSGVCTLRAAIMEANALPGADVINLQPNATYLLTRIGSDTNANAGDLDINGDLTINGADSIIDGNSGVTYDRVLEVISGNVTLSHMTIRNGKPGYKNDPYAQIGGGINNQAVLTLTHSIVISNTATTGGGINNAGIMTLLDSVVISNTASSVGGGLSNVSDVTILNSTIQNNQAGVGGGIASGALSVQPITVRLINSTLSGNKADSNGGGLSNSGRAELINATIANNVANRTLSGGIGGGVYNSHELYARNSIIANNRRSSIPSSLDNDCKGDLASGGYNLIEATSGCTIVTDQIGQPQTDVLALDPKLGPLQNNGGSTPTHALLLDSPAINTANPNGCRDLQNTPLAFDQRGHDRHMNGGDIGSGVCDIGAYEYENLIVINPVSTTYLPLIIR